ncbi:LPP20 family lipoprotein [Planktomarina sp.]|nr:LPP20 family lipoprotein [Planktomarina sp.]
MNCKSSIYVLIIMAHNLQDLRSSTMKVVIMPIFNLVKPIGVIAAITILAGCDTAIPSFQVQSVANNITRPTTGTRIAAMQQSTNLLDEKTKAAAEETFSPSITAVGFSAIAIQPSKNLNQRRLMAIRAAKLDAYRGLTEQIYGINLDGETTVAEAMLTSDKMSSAVRGTIMGAKTVKIEPTGNDTYEVELSVSEVHIRRLIQNYTRGLL